MASSQNSCPPTEIDSAVESPQRLYAKFESARARQELALPPPDPDPDTTQDILTIIPQNTEARRAFDTVAQALKQGTLDPLHAQYVCVTGTRPLGYHATHARNASGESEEDAPAAPPTIILTGHYRLRFSLAAVLKAPTWVIGRGSALKFGPTRNVDIILIAPGTTGYPSLAATHLYLGLHPESGAWRIKAGGAIRVEDEDYNPGEAVYLSRPKTRIELLEMQFAIRFEINGPDTETKYLEERNKMLQKEGFSLPHTDISGIPIQGDMLLDTIVFRHGIGSGSFGSVYEGFSPANGKLRVAKRIILKSVRAVPEVDREIQALQRFKGCPGIIELVEWRTSLNGKNLHVAQYPLDVYLIHDKGVAFDRFDWDTVSWAKKRLLCYQLLMGLTAVHGAGCMHRDITPMNILIFPHEDPPKAALCDFGKFCSAPTDVETRLAGWQFLPPELQKDQKNEYDQTLDIWMLGLALTYCWWPQSKGLHPRDVHDYQNMQEIVGKDDGSDGLGDLIIKMMARDPCRRPAAVDALKYTTLRAFSTAKTTDAAPTTTKRPYDASDLTLPR